VPHPRDVVVFVARVGKHDANLLGRINNLSVVRRQMLGACTPREL